MGENNQYRYFENLRKLMLGRVFIDEGEWEEFCKGLVLINVKKKKQILAPGQVENSARLIINGIVKIIHYEPQPYVFDFRINNDFLGDVVSLTGKTRSAFSFETITDCQLIETNYQNLMGQNSKIAQSFSLLVIDYLNRGHRRSSFLHIENAEKRYSKFLHLHPDIVKYAKQSDIASYLDITTQSLSRIRRKILTQTPR
ncbi:MAG: Crp/Fnr family transcriptional regulator [Draconibacterium sp.]